MTETATVTLSRLAKGRELDSLIASLADLAKDQGVGISTVSRPRSGEGGERRRNVAEIDLRADLGLRCLEGGKTSPTFTALGGAIWPASKASM